MHEFEPRLWRARPPVEAGVQLIRKALDLGVTHFDTAALYGFGRNEELLGQALGADRRRIVLASKAGLAGIDGKRALDARPRVLKATCEAALKRLRTDVIDLYYLHRKDKVVPIEDSIGALSELVREGKIGAIGVSEVSAETLRRAHAVHPIAAVQSEFSLFTRNSELGVLDTCRDIGAAFVAFSPLSRGLLSGDFSDAFAPGDIRTTMRFTAPHLAANLDLARTYSELVRHHELNPAQIALTWLMHRDEHVLPIPGTTAVAHLELNCAAASLELPAPLLAEIDSLFRARAPSGPRYAPAARAEIDTEEFD